MIKKELEKENPRLKGKNIVLYLPTFRSNEGLVVEDLDALFRFDKKNALITSLHPLSSVENREIYGVRGNYNTMDLLKCADAVVLDYSACAFEAAILEKKMYFYVPDYRSYDNNRGINIDLKKEMSPYVFEDAFSLKRAISTSEYDMEKVRRFKEKYVTETENCTKKLAEFICRQI